MKILLLSDSHGNARSLFSAVEKYGVNADLIVHCGDAPRGEAEELVKKFPDKRIVCVRGNCDWNSSLEDVEYIRFGGKKIMITHGHLFSVKYGFERIYMKALEEHCNLVFFGHTHNPTDVTVEDIRFINPGSCSRYEPVCATVEIDQKGNVLVNHVKID